MEKGRGREPSGRVLVGMSGGVDSSAAALLLQRTGYEVVGATFRLRDGLPGDQGGIERDIADARHVCQMLGIEHHVLDYSGLFRDLVLRDFVREYRRGATPNPCVCCNRHIKFGAFLQTADELGCNWIATGHYARIESDVSTGGYRLRRARDTHKDQTYVLYHLSQSQLARVLLPLGEYDKAQIRALVEQSGLEIAARGDSQDICFVPDGDYCAFLEAYTGERPVPGDFVDSEGRVLGRHQGIWHYTIGQRKGLGISFGKPMYVCGIDAERRTVILTGNENLFCSKLIACEVSYLGGNSPSEPFECTAKIRYSAQPAVARVFPLGGEKVRVEFEQPQRAITPGQSVVFYSGDYLIGGGRICALKIV